MNKNKPLLIFDFDGTIVESLTLGLKLTNMYASRFKYNQVSSLELIREHSGINFIRKNVKWYYLPFWLYTMKSQVMHHLDEIVLYPEIKETLNKLKPHYKLGLIGGGSKKYHLTLLEKHQINVFDFIYSNQAYRKEIKIKKHLKYHSNNEILMIGDDIKDIKSAQKIGLKTLAVAWGSSNPEILKRINPDLVVEDQKKLYDAIRSII